MKRDQTGDLNSMQTIEMEKCKLKLDLRTLPVTVAMGNSWPRCHRDAERMLLKWT